MWKKNVYKFRLLKQPHRMNAVWTNISFNVQTMPAITSDIKITVDCPHNKKPFYYSRKKVVEKINMRMEWMSVWGIKIYYYHNI